MCEDGARIVSSGRLGERESREHRIKAGGLPLALSLARKGGAEREQRGVDTPRLNLSSPLCLSRSCWAFLHSMQPAEAGREGD